MTDIDLKRKLARLTPEQQRAYSRMKLASLRTEVYFDAHAPSTEYQYVGICDGIEVCYAKTPVAAAWCAADRMQDNSEITLLMAA